jgi:RHS repeat-associated protein
MVRTFLRILVITAVLAISKLQAQVGGNNPTGVTGSFNGSINTAGSFDPFTANASRVITDISVDGAVGTIPLALTRVYNSRLVLAQLAPYGLAGGWQHSYCWFMPGTDDSLVSSLPTSYQIYFPDGRVENFSSSASDVYYRAAAGTRERFINFTGSSPSLGYLVLPDGSKVEFQAKLTSHLDGETHQTYYNWTFTVQALVDPFGLRTTISFVTGTLDKVTEPAGRYLQFYYTTVGGRKVLDHVTASDGRTVQYSYIQSAFSPGTTSYVCLDHIVYFGDATLTAHYKYKAPNTGNANGVPLLWTCDDPMYGGPMKRIGYVYATTNNADGTAPVYGEIKSENYYDGTTVGAALTTLTVNNNTRTETRADTRTRTFTYTGYLKTSQTDFKGIAAAIAYDSNSYVNAETDRNGHTTNFTNNALTGATLTTTFPSTPGDTPTGTPRGVVTCTYGSATCPDVNNRDANNPYYPYSTTDEGGHSAILTRDGNKRVTRIDYPDGGYETFTYNSFNQILSHQLLAGGTETFTYDAAGVKQTYRDPDHATGNPSAWYTFDSSTRLSGVTDALGASTGDAAHTTNMLHNARGQLTSTTFPTDPVDNQRHSVTSIYNPDGTLQSTTDQLSHMTSFTYDDYKRLLTTTTPQRATGDNTPRTTYKYYDASHTGNDYTHADANPTFISLPGGEITQFTYDENYRKKSMILALGTSDAATTSYGYDNVGNITSAILPREQTAPLLGQSTVATYDERDRLMSITDALNNPLTVVKYDAAGRKASVTRPNGQIITYDSYDPVNRLLQQTVKQTPSPDAVTKYTYYATGSVHTMQDPALVAASSMDAYAYSYDTMGRKTSLAYPPDSYNNVRSETWHYDVAGRNDTYTNRAGNTQTFHYDALNRRTDFVWTGAPTTPNVTYGYDAGSRLISVSNGNANISRAYLNDGLISSEANTYPGADNVTRTISYSYDADARLLTIQYPNNTYSITSHYTNRGQLSSLVNNANGVTMAAYTYDADGDVATRTLENSTSTTYTYDPINRATNISHALNGTTRTHDYGYDTVGNRSWTRRDGAKGDVFGYDLASQLTANQLDIVNPDTTPPGSTAGTLIGYGANGNRTSLSTNGVTDNYTVNELSQYTARNSSQLTYDPNGNITTAPDGSTFIYDAQNRVISATKAGVTETFSYDGLNRQICRTINGASGLYTVYDGWNLIAEYNPGAVNPITSYVYGTGGLVKLSTSSSSFYYYQDGSGSTSHLADGTGNLVESYQYDAQGNPKVFNAAGTLLPSSNYGIRHLFNGEQWYKDIGVYDLRTRFYSPDIGRFLQPDSISFDGDQTNLYRYCGNDLPNKKDPRGENIAAYIILGAMVILIVEIMWESRHGGGTNTLQNNQRDIPLPDHAPEEKGEKEPPKTETSEGAGPEPPTEILWTSVTGDGAASGTWSETYGQVIPDGVRLPFTAGAANSVFLSLFNTGSSSQGAEIAASHAYGSALAFALGTSSPGPDGTRAGMMFAGYEGEGGAHMHYSRILAPLYASFMQPGGSSMDPAVGGVHWTGPNDGQAHTHHGF